MRDPLLEQIHERWHQRIDRRLAVVLALSIGTHVAIAVAAWMGDPPVDRPLLVNRTAAVFTAEQIPDFTPPPPPPSLSQAPAPGVAGPAPAAVAPAPAPGKVRHRGTPRPVDAAALISDLTDDAGGLVDDALRHRPGKDLNAQIDAVRDRDAGARLGNLSPDDPAPRIHGGTDPVLDDAGAPIRTAKRPEAAPPRIAPAEPLTVDVPFDPSDEIRRHHARALTRCYRDALLADPTLTGRLDLTFTIGPDGRVGSASTRGLEPVGPCVARLARRWSFTFTPAEPVTFRLALVFVPG
jgi:hypothetical protein